LIVEKEAMAPCTYIELALGSAPGGRIRFESLKFTDIDGPTPVNGLLPGQALCFRDLDFMIDHLGQLRLSEENAAPSYISMPDHGPARAGPTIVDFDALACRIDSFLRANPEPMNVTMTDALARNTSTLRVDYAGNDQIQQGKREMHVFPRASQSVTAVAMIMQTAPEPSTDEGKHVHQELRDLLETTAVQQAQSFAERRHPEASLVHISSACGAPKGHHAPSELQLDDGGVVHRREISPACSRYIRNFNAHPTQGARRPGPDCAGKDLLHYGASDQDNHGWHTRVWDA
jgi:hypothetical protein